MSSQWEQLAARIVWTGKFRAPTPKKGKAKFDKFVARVSAIIRRAHGFAAPAPTLPTGVGATWDDLAAYIDEVQTTFGPDGERVQPNMSKVAIANLRARVGHVAPIAVTTDVVREALVAAPAGKRDSLRRAVRFFNGMITNRDRHAPIAHLLPPTRIGTLPILRDGPLDWVSFGAGFTESCAAAIEAAVRPQGGRRGRDRFGGRLGAPAPRGAPAGARRRRRRSEIPRLPASRTAGPSPGSPGTHFQIRRTGWASQSWPTLWTEENVERALRAYVERAADSAVSAEAANSAARLVRTSIEPLLRDLRQIRSSRCSPRSGTGPSGPRARYRRRRRS